MLSDNPAFANEKIALEYLSTELETRGFALLPKILSAAQCATLRALYEQEQSFRKTVSMRRYRFGEGEYKYWSYPLPAEVQAMREYLYPLLVPIANTWQAQLNAENRYPSALDEMLSRCHKLGQNEPTPLMLRYGEGGFNTLHQDLYGDVHFPFQVAVFLSEKAVDYTGGEFVISEQVPRAQTKVNVLTPDQGDIVIFATHYRPVKGARGFYRCHMRHGVSEVKSGQRYVMGLIFHDAAS